MYRFVCKRFKDSGGCPNPVALHLSAPGHVQLVSCPDGFHWSAEQLANTDRLAQMLVQCYVYRNGEPAILPSVQPSQQVATGITEHQCSICMDLMLPSPSSLVVYQEQCPHHFHRDCVDTWWQHRPEKICPFCRVPSRRSLLWSQFFATDADKATAFELQKNGFGLNVLSTTEARTESSPGRVQVFINGQEFTVRVHPELEGHDNIDNEDYEFGQGRTISPQTANTLQDLAVEILRVQSTSPGGVAPQFLFQTYQMQGSALDHMERRKDCAFLAKLMDPSAVYLPSLHAQRRVLLFNFRCPFQDGSNQNDNQRGIVQPPPPQPSPPPAGRCRCPLRSVCPFYHSKDGDAHPENVGGTLGLFPTFVCLKYSLYEDCIYGVAPKGCFRPLEAIAPNELPRCRDGFHLSYENLANYSAIIPAKIAQDILSRVGQVNAGPGQASIELCCALCKGPSHKPPALQNKSMYVHPRFCGHFFHAECFKTYREQQQQQNPSLFKPVQCPTCKVRSALVLVWPEPSFPNSHEKTDAFQDQLTEFKWNLSSSDCEVLRIEEKAENGGQSWFQVSTEHASRRVNMADVILARDRGEEFIIQFYE